MKGHELRPGLIAEAYGWHSTDFHDLPSQILLMLPHETPYRFA
jgi:hypothetical protein